MKDIGLEIDAVLRMAHGIQFRSIKILPVLEHIKTVVARNLRINERLYFVEEGRRFNARLRRICESVAWPRGEKSRQNEGRKCKKGNKGHDTKNFGAVEFPLEKIVALPLMMLFFRLCLCRQAVAVLVRSSDALCFVQDGDGWFSRRVQVAVP